MIQIEDQKSKICKLKVTKQAEEKHRLMIFMTF